MSGSISAAPSSPPRSLAHDPENRISIFGKDHAPIKVLQRPLRVRKDARRCNEAVADLKLEKGKQAYAVIKASDVMVGID